ncbi:hypothetical protein BOTBODRAFT_36370 [Botryobasidium botryosum FD-172 SS1]|uniref:Uncharacterized protein n=1 Tax=Botryobasidium botryosum (strain FD-172 SS1) TaxID=930990 RepID=A0A067M6D3_BOTB1|nr:hypothetical protein BOTBODRAFT_36370 [Botryobasidium botryosum FD-172 SS1]
MSSLTTFVVDLYRYLLTPIPPFASLGLPALSLLDFAGAFRLSVALRQLKAGAIGTEGERAVKVKELMKDIWSSWTVVFGGELMNSMLLSTPPSFVFSPAVPLLFAFTQTTSAYIPSIPTPAINNELPLAFLDALTRTVLLCNFSVPMVVNHHLPAVSSSPWALILCSTIMGNGGFFIFNALGMNNPGGWTLRTPPELGTWGWTATDIWCAPLITALYAYLTGAQPFWLSLPGVHEKSAMGNMDEESARAVCALVLATLFAGRAVRKHGGAWAQARLPREETEKIKEQ